MQNTLERARVTLVGTSEVVTAKVGACRWSTEIHGGTLDGVSWPSLDPRQAGDTHAAAVALARSGRDCVG